MKVIGLTDELRGAAAEQCGEGFRAWIAEAGNDTWGSWEELKRRYPQACRTHEEEVHFPLASDGTGVRARVFFQLRLLMLRCIAPAPVTSRMSHRRQISPPPHQTNTATAHQPS